MSRFWQLFWPALARKAGQRDPQTLVGGLGAHHGTSRSKSGKKFSPSAMTLGPKLHLLATSDIPAPTRQAYSAKSPQRAHPHLPGQCISEEPWRSHYIAICSEWVAKHSSKTRSRCQSEIRTIHYDSQLSAAKDKNITQRAAAARNLDAAITMRFPASRGKPACLDTHGNKTSQQSCSHSTAICNHRFQNTLQLCTHKHTQSSLKPPLQCGKTKRQTTRSRTRRTQEVPFIDGCIHFTRKNTVSCSGFLPNTSPMQRSCSHHNAFCSMTWLTRMYLRTWQHQITTIMQPFQCDPRPQIQETHRTTHTGTITRCRTQRRNQIAHETTPAAPAAHRRYLSSPAATTLHGKTHNFVLQLPPQHNPYATFMQPLQYVSQHDAANPHVFLHMSTPDHNNNAAIPMRSATTDSRDA